RGQSSPTMVNVGFFFQAEDGIRDRNVTGVQTCALPIWISDTPPSAGDEPGGELVGSPFVAQRAHHVEGEGGRGPVAQCGREHLRSEERRVGKEWRSRGRQKETQKQLLG